MRQFLYTVHNVNFNPPRLLLLEGLSFQRRQINVFFVWGDKSKSMSIFKDFVRTASSSPVDTSQNPNFPTVYISDSQSIHPRYIYGYIPWVYTVGHNYIPWGYTLENIHQCSPRYIIVFGYCVYTVGNMFPTVYRDIYRVYVYTVGNIAYTVGTIVIYRGGLIYLGCIIYTVGVCRG